MYNSNEKEDYFNAPIQPEAPKGPKEPALKPDDPRYYDNEDEWEHIRPASRNWKMWTMMIGCGVFLGFFIGLYIYYFTLYSEKSVQYGYIERIEKRGNIFKTFEGVFLPYKSLADTIEPYQGDLIFSTSDDHLAAELRKLYQGNLPARIEYKTFRAPMPWRGESKIVITAVDTADVSKIYPPVSNHPLIPSPHIPAQSSQPGNAAVLNN